MDAQNVCRAREWYKWKISRRDEKMLNVNSHLDAWKERKKNEKIEKNVGRGNKRVQEDGC